MSPHHARPNPCPRAAARERAAGRLALSPEEATPLGWWIGDKLHAIGAPLLILLASPVLIPASLLLLLRLRWLEKNDPELCDRCSPSYSDELAQLEDYDVSNQFTALIRSACMASPEAGIRRTA